MNFNGFGYCVLVWVVYKLIEMVVEFYVLVVGFNRFEFNVCNVSRED